MLCEEIADPDPFWSEKYRDKLLTPDQAVARIRPGQRIFLGTGCGQPLSLVEALIRRSGTLADCEIIDLFTLGEAPYARESFSETLRVNTFLVEENVREVVRQGFGAHTPIDLSDIPRLFSSHRIPLDVALVQVALPDAEGRFSLGISVDVVATAIRHARMVIAQVNPRMPRTLGDCFVTADDLDWLVPEESSLVEYRPPPPDPLSLQVAEQVATLIEDGATLALGQGAIPQAVLSFLGQRKHLGIHAEMITDTILEPVRAGVIDGAEKTLDCDRIVASLCMGSRELYDFLHNNPIIRLRPTNYVNDPVILAQQQGLVAVNTAWEIDLTGQVSVSGDGGTPRSIGGHVDFNRGAARAIQGKAIIALPSVTEEGGSRIVTRLAPGAEVVTTRGGVHYVVTEYGVAYLHGRSIHERALSLIGLAHPRFRERLLEEAVAAHFVHPQLADVRGRLLFNPLPVSTLLELPDGRRIHFRPILPTDDHPVRELFHGLSQQSVYNRFMTPLRRLTFRHLKDLVYIDHRTAVAMVGTTMVEQREEIVALGGYYLESGANRAEVALLVQDGWQRQGVGKFLLATLATLARRNGIAGFTATVLRDNWAMRHVFEHSPLPCRTRMEEGVLYCEMIF